MQPMLHVPTVATAVNIRVMNNQGRKCKFRKIGTAQRRHELGHTNQWWWW
jgi:hypothetical protein